MQWFFFAFISLIFFGLQKFLFKVSAEKGYTAQHVTLYFMLSVAIMGMAGHFYLYPTESLLLQNVIIYSCLNGILFLSLTLARLSALKLIPSVVAIPLFDLSFIFMFPLSIWLFNDSFTSIQIMGVIVGIIAGILLVKKEKEEHHKYPQFIKGIIYAIGAMLLAVILNVVTKYVAISQISKLSFIGLSYSFNTLLLLTSQGYKHVGNKNNTKHLRGEIVLGLLIGIVNFIAFFSNLLALQSGSVAIIGVIISFSSIIGISLSILFYKEKLTFQRALAIFLAFISLLLLR